MQLRLQFQQSPVADEVSAITAVVRPILEGLLYGLKADVVEEVPASLPGIEASPRSSRDTLTASLPLSESRLLARCFPGA